MLYSLYYHRRSWLVLLSVVSMAGCFLGNVDWRAIADGEKARAQAIKELGYNNLCEVMDAMRRTFVDALDHSDRKPDDLDYVVKAQAKIEYLGQRARLSDYRTKNCDIFRHCCQNSVGCDPMDVMSQETREKWESFQKKWHEAEVRQRETVRFKSVNYEANPMTWADLQKFWAWFLGWYLRLMMPAALSVIILVLVDNGWRFRFESGRVLVLATILWPIGLARVYSEESSVKLLREAEREYREKTGDRGRMNLDDLRALWQDRLGAGQLSAWAWPTICVVWFLGQVSFSLSLASGGAMALGQPVVMASMMALDQAKEPPTKKMWSDWVVIPEPADTQLHEIVDVGFEPQQEGYPEDPNLRPNPARGPPATAKKGRDNESSSQTLAVENGKVER